MKNSEIYSQKNYRKLYNNNKFLNFIRKLHIYGLTLIIIFLIFLGIIFNILQPAYKVIIIVIFMLHFQWDIFQECMLSYYQKKLLNKNYKLGELKFLSPDYHDDKKKISVNEILLNFSLNYYLPLLIVFILLKNKTKLLIILFSLTTFIHLKYFMEYYFYFNKYNVYGEEI